MIQIRPESDLKDKFDEIKQQVKDGEPVYLTQNGYGSMVVLSLEEYSKLVDEEMPEVNKPEFSGAEPEEKVPVKAVSVEQKEEQRMSKEQVFWELRKRFRES